MRTRGVWSAGRLTTVQPAASAGAILRLGRVIGKFQGVIVPTTPTGWWMAKCRFHDVGRRDDPAVGSLALLGEPLEGIGGMQDLGPGLGEGLALLHREGPREGVRPLAHQVGGLLEDLRAVVGGEGTPGGERLGGGGDGGLGVVPAAVGDPGQGRLVGGVDHVQPRSPLAPGAIDEHPGFVDDRCHESRSLARWICRGEARGLAPVQA
jgi:hypothetical protein